MVGSKEDGTRSELEQTPSELSSAVLNKVPSVPSFNLESKHSQSTVLKEILKDEVLLEREDTEEGDADHQIKKLENKFLVR